MDDNQICLGVLEVEWVAVALEAADCMLKVGSGQVKLTALKVLGPGHIALILQGPMAPLQAALEEGTICAERKGRVLTTNLLRACDRQLIESLSGL